jgi:hypothetical protein
MKKIPLLLAAMFVATAVASSAFAAGYGAAGCGWGGKVIGKNNDNLAQLGASILNTLSGNSTFAMTSGTSGCSKNLGGLVMAESEPTLFVQNNYNGLAKEMAAGEGEQLMTLAGLMGCSADHKDSFATFTKQNYDSIFVSEQTTVPEMLASLKKGLSSDPVLSTSCSKI